MKRPIHAVIALALALSLAVLLVAGCSGQTGGGSYGGGGSTGGTTGGTSGTTVTERNFAFDPASLTVSVGDTVTFVNEDSTAHDVEIDGKQLSQQSPGDKVEWKAEKAGTYPYRCTIHPSMTGEITVK